MGDVACLQLVYTQPCLPSHARQSERAYYLSYVIKEDNIALLSSFKCQPFAICQSEW